MTDDFDLFDLWHSSMDIDILIEWLEKKKKEGYTGVRLDLEYGYYRDVTDIKLEAFSKD